MARKRFRRAVAGARDAPRSECDSPVRIAVRLGQRAHWVAQRQPRRGRAAGLPGTYLNSFYEIRPLPYAEAGFGYPEAGQTVVDVTNGKIIRLLVGDEPFDVRYGKLLSHERVLDMRAGTLTRNARWSSPSGKQIKVTSTRLGVAGPTQCRGHRVLRRGRRRNSSGVTVQSELVTNEDQPHDVGRSAGGGHPGQPTGSRRPRKHGNRSTSHAPDPSPARCMMATAMDHEIDVPGRVEFKRPMPAPTWRGPRSSAGCARDEAAHRQIHRVRLVEPALPTRHCATRPPRHCTARATAAGRALLNFQRKYLDDFWENADVEVEGDAESQQAVRFGLFHLSTGQCALRRTRDPQQGTHRDRLRRPRLLGHRRFRAPRTDLHPAATR